ncbi:MAG TPA: hypothetical protein VMU34_25005 [Mycobacterium sp.]|nr:hypothetical protein [Mycobacterium sp.]
MVVAGMDQIQQTLKSENPAEPLRAIADRGIEPAAKLPFAQADSQGQARHRPLRPAPQHFNRLCDRLVDHRFRVGKKAGQHAFQERHTLP